MTASTFAAALADHFLAMLPDDRPLERDALAALPAPVGHFLSCWLAQHVGRVDASLRSPWVAETSAVAAARADLVATMQRDAQVPEERRAQVVRYATARIVSFLVAPAEAFPKTIEETGAGPYSVELVLDRLAWFATRPTLAEVLRSYFDWKGTQQVSASDLRRLLAQIDERLAQEESPSDWMDHLAPLFDLAAHVNADRHLSASVLRDHFAARGLDASVFSDDQAAVSEAQLLALLQIDAPRVPVSVNALMVEEDDLGFTAPSPSAPDAPLATGPDANAAVAPEDVPTEDSQVAHLHAEAPETEAEAPETEAEAPETEAEAPETEDVPSETAPRTAFEPAPEAVTSHEDTDVQQTDDSLASEPYSPTSALDAPLPDLAQAPLSSSLGPAPSVPAVPSAPETPSENETSEALTSASQNVADAAQDSFDPGEPPSSRPSTIEEATRDDQPLWSQYAAPDAPSVNDGFADPDATPASPPASGRDVPLWKRYFSGGDSGPASADEAPLPSEDSVDLRPAAVETGVPAGSSDTVPTDAPSDDVSSTPSDTTAPTAAPLAPESYAEASSPTEAMPSTAEATPSAAEATPSTSEPPPLSEAPRPTAAETPATLDDSPSALERRLLGAAADQRSWFVEQLTEGDGAAYDATLQAIDRADSWIEASQIISREIFRRYSVYIWSAPARAFTDAIESYFRTARTQAK
ncbi:MAG: hypothetical protein AAFU51_04830 [Bacteroidota bacterium]